ncbi:MAG: hypothetical protein IJZ01_02455 [Paraprevotella sp.]|nr:hypothetical protein [Paraprevotella sp.]
MTKKLLLNNGGMPLYLDDLDIIQQQIRTTNRINALYAGLHPDSTIAFGSIFEVYLKNGEDVYRSLSESYFQHDGDIYKMEAFDDIPVEPTHKRVSEKDNVIYIEFRQTQIADRMHNNGHMKACHATLTAHFWTYDEMIYQGRLVNNAIPDNFVHIDDIKIKGEDF